MVCKKCGYDGIEEHGDWITCPNCGAKYFNINIPAELSITKQIDAIESGKPVPSRAGRETAPPKAAESAAPADGSKQKTEPAEKKQSKKEPEIKATNKEEYTVKEVEAKAPSKEEFTVKESAAKAESKEEFTVKENAAKSPSKEEFTVKESAPKSPSKEEFTVKENAAKAESKEEFTVKESTPKASSKEEFTVKESAAKSPSKKELKEKKREEKRLSKAERRQKEQAYKESENKEEKKNSKLYDFASFMLPIVIAVIIALLLKTFVFANAVVPTGSMKDTINEGDRIIASRIAYLNSDPERYDIILFYYPDDESQIFVKRVIGLPGETVAVIDGITYITDTDGNTYQTDQSFVTTEEPTGNYGPYYIPAKGEVITTDGTYSYAENGMAVGGSQFIDVYCTTNDSGEYIVEENLYFCMGDNRNDSWDSRFWDNAYVAESKILGEAKFKYYPEFESLE